MRAPKGEVTSPRTGHSVGTPRLASSERALTSTASAANESLAAALATNAIRTLTAVQRAA